VSSAVFGQSETLTATVTSPAGTPTGTVTFFDGSTALGSVTVNAAGQATLTVSLGVGNHMLTASFAGTNDFAASTSAAAAETVQRASTTVAVSPSSARAGIGQPVAFTATVTAVSPGAGTPTGTVTFKDGNLILGTVTLGAGGTATLTTSFAAAGNHTITAVYGGDGNFVGSSQSLTEVVAREPSTTAIVASANPVRRRQHVTFTAMVRAAPGAGTPTGTVTFSDGSVAIAIVNLDANGQAKLMVHFTVVGKRTIRAVYSGDANFAGSSQSLTERVR
jgi:hypothetical protein